MLLDSYIFYDSARGYVSNDSLSTRQQRTKNRTLSLTRYDLDSPLGYILFFFHYTDDDDDHDDVIISVFAYYIFGSGIALQNKNHCVCIHRRRLWPCERTAQQNQATKKLSIRFVTCSVSYHTKRLNRCNV